MIRIRTDGRQAVQWLLAIALLLGLGLVYCRPVEASVAPGGDAPPTTVLWSATHESGNMSEWSVNGGGIFNSGTGTAYPSTAVARSGQYSAVMTINNAANQTQAVRLFRWGESRQAPQAYYSVWYYFPQRYAPHSWWNVMQWKSRISSTINDPLWIVNVGNRADGEMYFYLYDWINRRSHNQTSANVPVGRWFHLEAYYQQAADNTGRVTVWQDGAQILDVAGVATRRAGDEIHWSLANYTDGISPSTATIYADDAAISTGRMGVGVLALGPALPAIRPEFKLGFKTLADLLAGLVGEPLENERHNPNNGDGLQQTSRGLMVWRKADNWTAFTDGHRTWVMGPYGVQERLNTYKFPWETLR